MSQENVEVVQRLAERINARDIDGMLRLISPEIEYRTRENEPDAGMFRGQEEFAKFADSWLGAFDEYEVEIYDYIDAGEYVVAPGRARGRGRTSGIAWSTLRRPGYGGSETARRWNAANMPTRLRPSEPSGCRSKTLTPSEPPFLRAAAATG